MIVKCPYCRQEFKVAMRAIGQGTYVPPDAPLTAREIQILEILKRHGPLTVRAVQAIMAREGAAYNYHITQITLSRLVGRGLARMVRQGRRWVYALPPVCS
mgnify:CR=1 FL=1